MASSGGVRALINSFVSKFSVKKSKKLRDREDPTAPGSSHARAGWEEGVSTRDTRLSTSSSQPHGIPGGNLSAITSVDQLSVSVGDPTGALFAKAAELAPGDVPLRQALQDVTAPKPVTKAITDATRRVPGTHRKQLLLAASAGGSSMAEDRSAQWHGGPSGGLDAAPAPRDTRPSQCLQAPDSNDLACAGFEQPFQQHDVAARRQQGMVLLPPAPPMPILPAEALRQGGVQRMVVSAATAGRHTAASTSTFIGQDRAHTSNSTEGGAFNNRRLTADVLNVPARCTLAIETSQSEAVQSWLQQADLSAPPMQSEPPILPQNTTSTRLGASASTGSLRAAADVPALQAPQRMPGLLPLQLQVCPASPAVFIPLEGNRAPISSPSAALSLRFAAPLNSRNTRMAGSSVHAAAPDRPVQPSCGAGSGLQDDHGVGCCHAPNLVAQSTTAPPLPASHRRSAGAVVAWPLEPLAGVHVAAAAAAATTQDSFASMHHGSAAINARQELSQDMGRGGFQAAGSGAGTSTQLPEERITAEEEQQADANEAIATGPRHVPERAGEGTSGGDCLAGSHTRAVPQLPASKTKAIAVATHCPEEIYAQQWHVEDFSLLRKLYEGNLSVVCQAQHKLTGRHCALKIYKRSRLHEMERFQLAREICLHIRVLHPYIISLYSAWKDAKYVYLALEWAPAGNLFDFLVAQGGRLSEADAALIVMRPLLTALAYLHAQQLIHRDVKLENILMDASCSIKLADFGLAIDQKFEQANTRLGTFGYFAPEVLDCPLKKGPFDFKDQSLPGYDSKVDVWSAGVVAYELLTGKAPFSAASAVKIIEAIRHRPLQYPEGLSAAAQDFLSCALQRDPVLRLSARQLLQHPWLQLGGAQGGLGGGVNSGAAGGTGAEAGGTGVSGAAAEPSGPEVGAAAGMPDQAVGMPAADEL